VFCGSLRSYLSSDQIISFKAQVMVVGYSDSHVFVDRDPFGGLRGLLLHCGGIFESS
jgi:hypothetical protein